MTYRHTLQQVEDYKDASGINQSALKVLLNEGIESFLVKRDEVQRQTDLYYDEPKHFLIGTAVDVYFSHGKPVYETIYATSKLLKKPADKPLSIIHMVFDKARSEGDINQDIKYYAKDFYEAADQHAYYMNRRIPKMELVKDPKTKEMVPDKRTWKEDMRFTNMIADGVAQAYWLELIENIGKQLLAEDENDKICACIMSISTHPHTAYLFKEEENVDHIYQMPLFFELNGVSCKILPDKILIDHNHKMVMPFDIKTIGRYVTSFNKEVRFRRYDIQGAFYSKGIELNYKAISNLIGRDITGYQLANFAFIAESTLKPGTPLVYVLSDEVMKEGIYGDAEEDLKGCKDALMLYKDWQDIDFSLTAKYKPTNGVVVLEKGYHKNRV